MSTPWNVRLETLADVLGKPIVGAQASVVLMRVSTDSRDIEAGDLFVALPGERTDGHAHVGEAKAKGAVAALVERPIAGLPYILVPSTVEALALLGAWWRQACATPMIAITGSNGKTTVKEMIAHILRAHVERLGGNPETEVLATPGNFNNHLGLPLTLLGLRPSHRYAVVEMGMNHAGELAQLTKIARPNLALINNVQRAHIGMFGSLEEVAQAKSEILDGLPEDGIAILNADDAFVGFAKARAGARRQLYFSAKQTADVGPLLASVPVLNAQSPAQQLVIQIGGRQEACHLPLMGPHNAHNALAAVAAAMAFGVPTGLSLQALESFTGSKGRLKFLKAASGASIIDDTYNANPDSVLAALAVLGALPGQRMMILGDLGELGEGAPAMHREVGIASKAAKLDYFFGLGVLVEEAVHAYGGSARATEDIDELCTWVKPLLHKDMTVLVKGSRFMKMERVVKELSECC